MLCQRCQTKPAKGLYTLDTDHQDESITLPLCAECSEKVADHTIRWEAIGRYLGHAEDPGEAVQPQTGLNREDFVDLTCWRCQRGSPDLLAVCTYEQNIDARCACCKDCQGKCRSANKKERS